MEDELKNNPITDSQNGVVVDDEDDDTPTLSSETLAEQNGPPVNAEPEEKEVLLFLWKWSQLVPMLPVENCDNVFQTVDGLLPGYHQVSLWVISFFFFGTLKQCRVEFNVGSHY